MLPTLVSLTQDAENDLLRSQRQAVHILNFLFEDIRFDSHSQRLFRGVQERAYLHMEGQVWGIQAPFLHKVSRLNQHTAHPEASQTGFT